MAVLTVGPGMTFSTVAAAIAAANTGDTVQVQAGTYTNDFAAISKNITLQAVGGLVNMVSTEQIPNGKAIFVTNGNITINGFSFSGASVADDNGAGIRSESGNLVLNDDYFFDNQEGLLAGANSTETITINDSEFASNGIGDGFTHNLYVGAIAQLTVNNSYFHDANVGHEIKSRAATTIIENSRIFDGPNGTASYSIDLPNGGVAQITNNIIEQGPNSQNPVIIAYGEEGSVYAPSSLQISGNQILNDLNSSSARAINNATSITAQITGNQFYGLTSGQIIVGPNAQSNNSFLTTEPSLDTAHPWDLPSAPTVPPASPAPSTPSAPPVPAGTTADMVLRQTSGQYEIYNIGNNAISAAAPLGQVGVDYGFVGLGSFATPTMNGMMLRSAASGNFEAYGINNNQVVGAASLGAVGANWQLAGFGDFNGASTTTDMMLRDSSSGAFELYTISNNAVASAHPIGAVGVDWQVQGFGDFNGDGTDDMMLRNAGTGMFEDYDIQNGQVVAAQALGAVGNDWQLVGIDDFNGDGTDDMMLRNTTTGVFEIYTIKNDEVVGASQIGAVGLDWQVAGFGPCNGPGSADMVLHDQNNGNFEVYDISGGHLTGASPLGAVGLDWQVGGIQAHLPS